MERVTSGLGPLVLGSVGLMVMYYVMQRLRVKNRVQDSVVVITGASSGLGKECARIFHAAGARLILCGRNPARLHELAEELGETTDGKRQTYAPRIVTFDLSNMERVAVAGEEILKCYGHVDVLINNAGISYRGSIVDTHVSVQREVMETNYFGPVALTQAILPSMVQRCSGHIVTISSIQGRIAIPYRSAYAASKHATQAYFDCLRAEVESFGLQVTVISPGYIKTNLSVNAVTGDGSKYGGERGERICAFGGWRGRGGSNGSKFELKQNMKDMTANSRRSEPVVMDKTTATGRDPVDVAYSVLMAVNQRQKDVLLAGPLPSVAVYIRTLWPALFFKLMASRARKEQRLKEE